MGYPVRTPFQPAAMILPSPCATTLVRLRFVDVRHDLTAAAEAGIQRTVAEVPSQPEIGREPNGFGAQPGARANRPYDDNRAVRFECKSRGDSSAIHMGRRIGWLCTIGNAVVTSPPVPKAGSKLPSER